MATKKVKFTGPPGLAIQGVNLVEGEEYEYEDAEAEQLAAGPHFEPVGWSLPKTQLPGTHKALDALAVEYGVEFPSGATVAEKQELLDEAESGVMAMSGAVPDAAQNPEEAENESS